MRLKHDLSLRIIKVLNVILISVPFIICWYLFYGQNLWKYSFHRRGNYVVFLLFLILYCVFARIYDAFLVSLSPVSEMLYSQALSFFFSDGMMYIIICLLSRHIANILPLISCFVIQTLFSLVWCILSQRWYYHCFSAKKTVIIYDMREGMERLIHQYGMDKKFQVIGSCSTEECLENDLRVITDDVEVVYLCGVHSHDRNIILKHCMERKITAYVIPRVGDVIMSSARKMHMFHLPMLRVERYNPDPEYLFIKRLFDVLLSAIAILLLSPLMLITALAVKADGGPAIYKQVRLTKDGKAFKLLKFRSMRVDAEKDGVARLSTGNSDDRITKVGRVIRKIRFDELPQLFNILSGDMSIVGPRPERPEIAKQYEEEMPEFRLRLQAKAGLTGYAQVYGKYNTTPYDKLQMDLMYIAHPSLIEDLRICFATIKILFLPESTEGVAVGATTAMDYENAADSTENDTETVTK